MNDLALVKKVIDDPVFVQRFTETISAVYKHTEDASKGVFQQERLNFYKLLTDASSIPESITTASAQGVFMEVVTNGLSFSTTAGLVYLKTRNVKNRAGQWETKLVYQPSPKGNIHLAEQAGSIANCSEPVTVLYSDKIDCGTKPDGTKYLEHKKVYPKTDKRILLVYCWVTFTNGAKEPFWLDEDDMERLKGYSAKDNRKNNEPNALYSSGFKGQPDEGFWKAKVINFALKNKRKKALNKTEHLDVSEDAEIVPTEDVPHEEVPAQQVQSQDPAQPKTTSGPEYYNQDNVYPSDGNNYRQPQYREPAVPTVNDEPF